MNHQIARLPFRLKLLSLGSVFLTILTNISSDAELLEE